MTIHDDVAARRGGFLLYAMTPPRLGTDPERVVELARRTVERLEHVDPDGVLLYDIDDESERNPERRPFPFVATMDPAVYHAEHLAAAGRPAVIYRAVGKYAADDLAGWARTQDPTQVLTVFVGGPTRDSRGATSLREAYAARTAAAPDLLLGAVCIPERHTRRGDEHLRMLDKQAAGVRFFVTQIVHDVNACKNLVSDYVLACAERGVAPVPVVFTFSVIGDVRTLDFVRWLGVDVPRWVENDLRTAADPLALSHHHARAAAEDLLAYGARVGAPVGLSVESVSTRRVEIEQSVQLAVELGALLRV